MSSLHDANRCEHVELVARPTKSQWTTKISFDYYRRHDGTYYQTGATQLGPKTAIEKRCGKPARLLARVPFGWNFVEIKYCLAHALQRAQTVKQTRGREVELFPL